METTFLLRPTEMPKQKYAFIGVPHDAATSLGNPGARFAPSALRAALRGVFDWRLREGKIADMDTGIVDLSAVEVADWGEVALSYYDTLKMVEQIYAVVTDALRAGYTPLVVGGDHSITFPPVQALHDSCAGKIGMIQIDAHNDLMSFSERQGKYSGSSGMRRASELERLAGSNIVQVGLRGYATLEQYEIGRALGVQRIGATGVVERGAQAAADEALRWAGAGTEAIYLTIDMDVINAGEAPGTGWPEPGGLTAQQVFDFVRAVAPFVHALDIAELNPLYDTRANATVLIAARILLDFITVRARTTSSNAQVKHG